MYKVIRKQTPIIEKKKITLESLSLLFLSSVRILNLSGASLLNTQSS